MTYDASIDAYFVKLVDGDNVTRYIPIRNIACAEKVAAGGWLITTLSGDQYASTQNAQVFIDALGVWAP